MSTMTRTPEYVQALIRSMDGQDDILDTDELDQVIAYARTYIPEITDGADWDWRCSRVPQENIYGVEYVPGPTFTVWAPDSDLGVMISVDTLKVDGTHYSNGYTSVVSYD